MFGVGTKLKESIFKNINQIIPLLLPEHGFCQQNGSERGQVQDWYPNEKNGGGPHLFVDVVLQSAWVLHCIN